MNSLLYHMISSIKFKRPSPTKVKPSTSPPLNANLNPPSKLYIANLVVLTLALTATCMPMYPDTTEVPAPTKKGIVV